MNHKTKTRWVILTALLAAATSWAQVPAKVGYSGRVLKANGAPETGMVTLKYTLFDSAAGGTALWSETQNITLSAEGVYSTFLGSVNPLPATVFDGTGGTRYLELQVNGGTPLAPRQEVASVPFAHTARNVKGGAVDATSLKVNGQDVFTNGRLSSSFGYQAGSGLTIDSNNGISLTTSCANGQVLVWNSNTTTWDCGAATGPAGQSVTSSVEPAGTNCPTGGTKLISASGTTYVCNGAQGATGATGTTGAAGTNGTNGVSVTSSVEPAGANCATGGTRLVSASGTTYVCNGAQGPAGSSGGGGNGRNLFLFDGDATRWQAYFTVTTAANESITANTQFSAEGDSAFDFFYGDVGYTSGIVAVWNNSTFIQVDPTKTYEGRIKAWAINTGVFTGDFYAGFIAYDKAKAPISSTFNSFKAGTTNCVPFIANAIPPARISSTAFTQFAGKVSGEGTAANQFPAGTRYIKPCVATNVGGAGTVRLDGFEIFENDTNAGAAVVKSYATAGTYTFTVPSSVTRVYGQVVGGGGNGGSGAAITFVSSCANGPSMWWNYQQVYYFGGCTNSTQYTCGAGGSGGGYAADHISVTPGQQLTVVVGAAGSQSKISDGTTDILVGNGGGNAGGAAGTALVRGSATPTTGVVIVGKQGGGGTGGVSGFGGSAGAGGNNSCSSAGGQAGQPGAVVISYTP